MKTLTAYTPLFDSDGNFRRWLAVGTAELDEQGNAAARIDCLPVNPEDFTGYLRFAPEGATLPPPTVDECQPPFR